MWTIYRLSYLFGLLDMIAGAVSFVLNSIIISYETPSPLWTALRWIQIIFSPVVIWYGIRLYGRKTPSERNPTRVNMFPNQPKMDLLLIHCVIATFVYPKFVAVCVVPPAVIVICILWNETTVQFVRNGLVTVEIRSSRTQVEITIRDTVCEFPEHKGDDVIVCRCGVPVGDLASYGVHLDIREGYVD